MNRLDMVFNLLGMKILLILDLRAIWNKDFIGKRAINIFNGLVVLINSILVTLILSLIMAGLCCRILLLIDSDN